MEYELEINVYGQDEDHVTRELKKDGFSDNWSNNNPNEYGVLYFYNDGVYGNSVVVTFDLEEYEDRYIDELIDYLERDLRWEIGY